MYIYSIYLFFGNASALELPKIAAAQLPKEMGLPKIHLMPTTNSQLPKLIAPVSRTTHKMTRSMLATKKQNPKRHKHSTFGKLEGPSVPLLFLKGGRPKSQTMGQKNLKLANSFGTLLGLV